MTLKKVSIILTVLIGLTVLYPYAVSGAKQIHGMFTFDFSASVAHADSTTRRHLNEDLEFKEKRLWHLEHNFPEGLTDPEVVTEIIRLRNEITALKKKLGYL